MIAKQIDPPGLEVIYNGDGELCDVRTEVQTSRVTKRTRLELVYMPTVQDLKIGEVYLGEEGVQQLEAFLVAIHHLRPGGEGE